MNEVTCTRGLARRLAEGSGKVNQRKTQWASSQASCGLGRDLGSMTPESEAKAGPRRPQAPGEPRDRLRP